MTTTLLQQVQAQEVRYSKIVGWTLAKARTDRNLTQKDLAGSLCMQQSVVSRIESGSLPLSVERLALWAAVLEISSVRLIGMAEESAYDLEQKGYRVTYSKDAP